MADEIEQEGRDMATEPTPEAAETAPEERAADPAREYRARKAEATKGTIERRDFVTHDLECRELDDGTLRVTGYASVTETPYEVGPWVETVKRSAFKRTLAENPDCVLLANHEGLPMARTRAGTLALGEDARGLRFDADLDPADPDSQTLVRKIQRGDIDQCSMAFQVTDQEWREEFQERDIKSLSLHRGDVSVVTMGASPTTSVSVLRSADGEFELRAGKEISAENMPKVQGVLDLLARSDEPPEAPEVVPEVEERAEEPVVMPDYKRRAREQRERLARMRRAS